MNTMYMCILSQEDYPASAFKLWKRWQENMYTSVTGKGNHAVTRSKPMGTHGMDRSLERQVCG